MNQKETTITYDDKIARYFLWATMGWGIVGMLLGVLAALQLAWWPANTGLSFLTFGRIRPLHTEAVIFAFAGNSVFLAVYYSVQRLLKTRLWSDKLSNLHFWSWQIIIVCVAVTYLMGINQGKEYAAMEWWIDVLIAVSWVIFAVNTFMTIKIRRVKHLYVAIWFYIATILTIAMLHIVNNIAIPLDFSKSYTVYSGVTDALVQWWYGHNAVGFLLTTPFLGMMYYFLPKAAGKPVFSYRLSIIHFWSLVFLYIWAGPHHLLYTSLPEWAQSLGMVFSIMLIAPSWGGMLNGLLTLRGAWHKLKSSVVLKFYVMAITFYGMSTLEGPLLSIKGLNKLSHYTDWTIAHVHGGALGWVGGMIFGTIYWLTPKLFKKSLYSEKLATQHFWLATIGMVFYIVSMWTAGITQGLMWFAEDSDGLLRYPQFIETVLAIKPLYWVRLFGGSLYLYGALIGLYVMIKTAQGTGKIVDEKVKFKPEVEHPAITLHEKLENKAFTLAALCAVVISIGGIIEFLPTLVAQETVPKISTLKPYTPLELEGRDIYVKEGCYHCHSQMVRTIEIEERRYGEHSRAGEFAYDFPFQWGSKRTGPDLHRVGGKYPHLWHYKHFMNPRSTSPGSIMPNYSWFAEGEVNINKVKKKMKAMKTLGVPYTDENIESFKETYKKQALEIATELKKDGIKVLPTSEMVAIIAYMQRLGTDFENLSDKDKKKFVSKEKQNKNYTIK